MDYWLSACETAKLAAAVESKGAAFYKHLQGVTGDATLSDMCAFFAEQEKEHQAKFLSIAEAHRTSESELCYSVDVCGMMKASMRDLAQLLDDKTSAARRPATVSECLTLAAKVEATAISVYTKMTEAYATSFSGVLREVLEEERKHLQMIQDVRKRLQPPVT